ncbi:MAG: endonuclease/exonuclease/phosphatase family protein [Methylococcales bacterium]
MFYWQKPIAVPVLVLLLGILGLIRYQGWQYAAAYTGAGFAAALPDTTDFSQQMSCNTQPLRVLSFNVRYGSAMIELMAKRFRGNDTGDGFLPWSARIPEISTRIASYSADLLGLQEMDTDADIGAIVPLDEYSLVSYHLGALHYGDSALLYKTKRFAQLDSGQVWLGPNPDLPMSLGFKPLAMVRYVNWVMLREKSTGFTFMFVNTHFDNARKNKEPSATLFRQRIASLAQGLPIIVSGDFNTSADTERYRRFTGANESPPLLENAYEIVNTSPDEIESHPSRLEDHIFAGGPCKVEADQWRVDTRPLKNGQPMSDHYPIFAQLRFAS